MLPVRARSECRHRRAGAGGARGDRGDHRRLSCGRHQCPGRVRGLRLRLHPPLRSPAGGHEPGLGGAGRLRGGHAPGGPGCRPTWSRPGPKPCSRTAEASRLFELSELLVKERSVDELLADHRADRWAPCSTRPGVTLLVPTGERLEIAASAGEALSPDELGRLDPRSGVPVSLGTRPGCNRRHADRGPVRIGPAGRHPGHAGACPPPRPTGPCSAPSPTMPPWPWSGPNCASRPCAPNCWRRSTGCDTP